MAGRRVHVVMSAELLARVDVARVGMSRGEFVRRAVERALGGDPLASTARAEPSRVERAQQAYLAFGVQENRAGRSFGALRDAMRAALDAAACSTTEPPSDEENLAEAEAFADAILALPVEVTDEMVHRACDAYMGVGEFVREMPMRAALEAALNREGS